MSITVVIPTYNRAECMKVLLYNCINVYKGILFEFEIHDSSTNDDIRDMCTDIIDSSSIAVKYIHYDESIGMDRKLITAIRGVETEYFYIVADGYLVDFNKLEMILKQQQFNEYDVIDLEREGRRGLLGFDEKCICDKIYSIDNICEYAEKYYSHLTCWGSEIIKKDFYSRFLESNKLKIYLEDNISWWLASGIFEAADSILNDGNTVRTGVIYSDCIIGNKEKKGHGWTKGENYYIVTMKVLNKDIDILPHRYDDVKDKMIEYVRNDSLASRRFLRELRYEKTLTFARTIKYRKDIRRVPGLYIYMLVLSICPIKALQLLKKLKNLKKKS
ncbi:MAG: glycosyltransferase [Lachnospiraceae bacterium]|nr:glycosyltransferase [Lachnospiraceae bacterium]